MCKPDKWTEVYKGNILITQVPLLPFLLQVIRCSCLCPDTYLMVCNSVTGARSETRQTVRLQAGLLTCSAAIDSATFSANFSARGICYSSHCSCCASARDFEW